MDLTWSPAGIAFRSRLRAWLADNLDPDWTKQCLTLDSYIAFQRDWDRRLFAGGWAGIWWPEEYGGSDASLEERAIYAEEMARAHAPDGLASLGRIFIGPGIMRFGTPEQKEMLGAILRGDAVWCQGFSEPEAGSDLGSVRTKAVRNGDRYVINGTKLWTTRGHYSTHCALLARTDASLPKHKGLSVFLVDMASPGIEVRPLRQINGKSDFNQLYLTDVVVPASARLGAEGQGWEVAMHILGHERGPAMALRGSSYMEFNLRHYREEVYPGTPPSPDFMRSAVETTLTRLMAYQIISDHNQGQQGGEMGSLVKLFWNEAWQRLAESAFVEGAEEVLARYEPAPFSEDLASQFLDSRRVTISGGTAEIQRNIIATRILGLPRSK